MMQSLAPLLKSALGFSGSQAAAVAVPAFQRLFCAASGSTKRLYVGNLNFQTKAEQLAQHFGSYGSVQDVVIPLDGMGRSRGYAFVEMDPEGAEAASNGLNQSEFMGRTIFVNEARPREERPQRQFRGRNRQQDGEGGWGRQEGRRDDRDNY